MVKQSDSQQTQQLVQSLALSFPCLGKTVMEPSCEITGLSESLLSMPSKDFEGSLEGAALQGPSVDVAVDLRCASNKLAKSHQAAQNLAPCVARAVAAAAASIA